jgi:hypothetical protein
MVVGEGEKAGESFPRGALLGLARVGDERVPTVFHLVAMNISDIQLNCSLSGRTIINCFRHLLV